MIGIYKIENKINQHVYIGQSNNIETRWKQHRANIKNGTQTIYKAIRKYGLNNFDFSVLEECSLSELNEREKYWINFYNSYENGYNENLGGEGVKIFTQKFIDQIIFKWEEGYSISQIANFFKKENYTIQHILRKFCNSYSGKESVKRGKAYQQSNLSVIYEFNKDNKIINKYSSMSALAKEFKISQQSINSALKACSEGIYYHNRYFSFNENCDIKDIWKNYNFIEQLDFSNNIIAIYSSTTEIIEKNQNFKALNIRECLNGKRNSAYNYFWRYYGENKKYNPKIRSTTKIVVVVNPDGTILGEYLGVRKAAEAIGYPNISGTIVNCCNGKQRQSHGYTFYYK